MRNRSINLSRRSWLILASAFLFFVAGQVGFRVLVHRHPESCELEYGQNLIRLRARLAEKPGHPLILVLGNSRAGRGFRPADLPPLPGDPIVFDFTQSGSGPIHNRIWLHRLLQEGIRPAWVIVETWPPFWYLYKQSEDVLTLTNLGLLHWSDVHELGRYAIAPRRMYRHWLEYQLAPMVSSRGPLLRTYLPAWLPAAESTIAGLEMLDGDGWRPAGYVYDPNFYRMRVAAYRATFAFMKDFAIPPASAAALRDTLAICRTEGIRSLLLLMPESSDFRRWYTPTARALCDRLLHRLSRAYDAPLIDARSWQPDDQFIDPAHLIWPGATAFTQRFGCVVLRPLLKGEPLRLSPAPPPSMEIVVRHE